MLNVFFVPLILPFEGYLWCAVVLDNMHGWGVVQVPVLSAVLS